MALRQEAPIIATIVVQAEALITITIVIIATTTTGTTIAIVTTEAITTIATNNSHNHLEVLTIATETTIVILPLQEVLITAMEVEATPAHPEAMVEEVPHIVEDKIQ